LVLLGPARHPNELTSHLPNFPASFSGFQSEPCSAEPGWIWLSLAGWSRHPVGINNIFALYRPSRIARIMFACLDAHLNFSHISILKYDLGKTKAV
jgi:hypothetical protein